MRKKNTLRKCPYCYIIYNRSFLHAKKCKQKTINIDENQIILDIAKLNFPQLSNFEGLKKAYSDMPVIYNQIILKGHKPIKKEDITVKGNEVEIKLEPRFQISSKISGTQKFTIRLSLEGFATLAETQKMMPKNHTKKP